MSNRARTNLSFLSEEPVHAEEFLAATADFDHCDLRIFGWDDLKARLVVGNQILIADNIREFRSTDTALDLLDLCRRQSIPVMAVIADCRSDRAAVFHAGYRDYIGYPFITEEIRARLISFIAGSAGGRKNFAASGINSKNMVPATAREQALVAATCAFLKGGAIDHDFDRLAREMGSNRNSLARAFRRHLGKGPYAWLREERIREAAILLETTERTVQTIGFDTGYEDPANFSTAFRQVYGVSPRAYRNKVRGAQE